MRNRRRLAALFCPVLFSLAACSSTPRTGATLTLNDRFWDHVNVEVVHTTSDDCDNRGKAYIGSETFTMRKGTTRDIEAPRNENICWRHDRNPNDPQAGVWSGWSKAVLTPGGSSETDL